MEIAFTIYGNQDDPTGNPIPKLRKTLRSQWTPEAQRYGAWKSWVQKSWLGCLTQRGEYKGIDIANVAIMPHGKPIILLNNQKARMDIRIFWKNGAHGDPENVFGSIADALFENDKNLDGSFESGRAPDGRGRVEAKIIINQEKQWKTEN